MDYRALAELVMMGLLGLSVLTVAVGFSVRAFLAPTLRELFNRADGSSDEDRKFLAARLEVLEGRLADVEEGLDRVETARDFDRQLEASTGGDG